MGTRETVDKMIKEQIKGEQKRFLRYYEKEGHIIKGYVEKYNIDVIIELGCWVGCLPKNLYDMTDCRLIVYDANPYFVEATKDLIGDLERVDYRSAVIIPPFMDKKDCIKLSVPKDDSTLSVVYEPTSEMYKITPDRVIYLDELVDEIKDDLDGSFFLVDIEGVDLMMITYILDETPYRPSVIQFELNSTGRTSTFSNIVLYSRLAKILNREGYKTPLIQGNHDHYSIICTPNESQLLGFYPDINYGTDGVPVPWRLKDIPDSK